jgi:hypothetical protein
MERTNPPQTAKELMDRYHRGERDFSGIDLEGGAFEFVTLRGANFRDAILLYAHLFGSTLTDTCFDGAALVDLQGYHLSVTHCSFQNASFNGADISNWDGYDNDFTEANLTGAYFRDVNFGNSNFTGATLFGTGLITCDIRALCRANTTLVHNGPSYVDYKTVIRSLLAPNLKDFLLRTGMPPIFVEYAIECAQAIDNPVLSRMMQSTFISYGGPDAAFARKLYEALHENGVTAFFFPEHATPGKRLHRVMREGVNQHDRVVLICSEASLSRPGVLNEIEETLAREAREGGESYLIPVRLDDYVFTGWAPARPDLAQAIRDRVVADFTDALTDESRFNSALLRLLSALRR